MENIYYYKGLFIIKDIGGDGWNIYQGHKILDEGYPSLKAAVQAIDEIPIEQD